MTFLYNSAWVANAVVITFLYLSAFCSFTVVHFQYKYLLLPLHALYFHVLVLIPFKMPSTLEFSLDNRNTNSSIQEIEVQCTRMEYCSKHHFIVFRHQDNDTISTKVISKRLDDLEWTQNVVLHTPDSIKFYVTYKCPGVQDLAACVFNKEHHADCQKPGLCHCFQWV